MSPTRNDTRINYTLAGHLDVDHVELGARYARTESRTEERSAPLRFHKPQRFRAVRVAIKIRMDERIIAEIFFIL